MEIRNERVQILLAVHKLSIYGRRLFFGKNILHTQTRLFRGFDLARRSGGMLFGVRGVSENCEI